MKNLYKLIVLSGMALFLGSCYYDTFPEDTGTVPDEVSYQQDVQPIWNAACIECHGPIPPNLEDGVSYNNLLSGGYVVPGDSENSILYQSLLGIEGVSLMPPSGKLPDSQINIVKKWIDDGAENN
jgi:hypothetical protein